MPSKPNKTKKSSHRGKLGSVRVIAGKYKNRKLDVLNADGLRPSTDRIRETLFNWLMRDTLDASVLDMFAGSGVLGVEAMSRGARDATFIEKNKSAFNILENNVTQLGVENVRLLHGDAISVSASLKTPFSLVFIDPPFAQHLLLSAVNALVSKELLCEDAAIYIEHESSLTPELPTSLVLQKQIKTSNLVASLFRFIP